MKIGTNINLYKKINSIFYLYYNFLSIYSSVKWMHSNKVELYFCKLTTWYNDFFAAMPSFQNGIRRYIKCIFLSFGMYVGHCIWFVLKYGLISAVSAFAFLIVQNFAFQNDKIFHYSICYIWRGREKWIVGEYWNLVFENHWSLANGAKKCKQKLMK